jgi:hemoglobin
MQSFLYDRLGGMDAITAVVDDFVAACANDSRINAKFARTDIPRLKAMLVDQAARPPVGHAHTPGET